MARTELFKCDFSQITKLAKQLAKISDQDSAKPSVLGAAVAAGAREIYLNMQRIVPVNTDGTAKDPGLLRDSVYRYFDPSKSPNGNYITYQVGVNLRTAPHFHLAEEGHKFYSNYKPFKIKGGLYRSRNKDSGLPLGFPVFSARPRPYLKQSFSPSVLQSALRTVVEEYKVQFLREVYRKTTLG